MLRTLTLSALAALLLLAFTGCSSVQTLLIDVDISPTTVTLPSEKPQHFTATVSGLAFGDDDGVAWEVESGGGVIDPVNGDFIAPDAPATCVIKAHSLANPLRTATATVTVVEQGEEVVGIWGGGVPTDDVDGPPVATTFTLASPTLVQMVITYHYNGGLGAAASGTLTFTNGATTYGPYVQSSFPLAPTSWYAYPNVTLPAGTYTAHLSVDDTWSYNLDSGNRGFFRLYTPDV